MKANQDIRQYMADHGVTQKMLAAEVGATQPIISKELATEMSEPHKVAYMNIIDSIATKRLASMASDEHEEDAASEETTVEEVTPAEVTHTDEVESEDVSCSTRFQLGDRVKIPSKSNKIGTISDIWSSLAKSALMYAVEDESDGHLGLYAENQLELAPLPIAYSFEAHIDCNVAVVTMNATQGDKTWVYARGHAHILHDGEVGMAQAVSYASRRMFESLDRKQANPIYFNGKVTRDDN
jgi:hypothetical protein